MTFRPLLLLVVAATAVVSAAASELTISRVYTGWRDAASFKRISEYFDGKENTGSQTVLRTHPEQRTGYYFLVRVANPGAARPVRVQLQLIEQNSSTQRSVIFPAELKAGSNVFQLGLTGTDWQDAKAQPLAWQVRILTADGQELAAEKSYLWEKPAVK